MIDVTAELVRIHGLEWDKIPGELEHLVYRLELERDNLKSAALRLGLLHRQL